MRAVLVNFPDSMVEERRRLGIDGSDELWDGEWHFVNPPKMWHQVVNYGVYDALSPLARRRGLLTFGDNTGIFGDPDYNWRIADQVYAKPEDAIEDGLTSAEFLVEVYAKGSEAYEKLPYYAARGVAEVLIVKQDRTFELRRLGADAEYVLVPDGVSHMLCVTFSTVEGPKLRMDWEGGSAEV